VFSRYCFNCHVVDGVGGKDGPALSHVGLTLSASAIEQRIVDPLSVDPQAEMPSFADKMSHEDIRKIASWLATRK
jgi:mono/diheme cytochrome c family protein